MTPDELLDAIALVALRLGHDSDAHDRFQRVIAHYHDKLATAQIDGERLDWMEDFVTHATVGYAIPADGATMTIDAARISTGWVLLDHDNEPLGAGAKIRDAIDQAMRNQEEVGDGE